MNLTRVVRLLAAAMAMLLAATAAAKDSLPQVSHDGLHLVKDTKLRAVYMRPGADLEEYDKVALLDAYVSFRKNWQRDYNEQTLNLMDRVSDKDMKKIRDELAELFNEVFSEVLTKGGHQVVTEGGAGVLVVQPAIVNLDVTAPDTMSPGMERSFATSAGQMTLYMQLYDGKTGDIIARVIDPKAAGNEFVQVRNSVTNRADAERVLRRWATILNDHLATVGAKSGAGQ